MCYHAAAPSRRQLQKQFLHKEVRYEAEELFHVSGFARPYLPVTLNVSPEAIVSARWKLIPFWVKSEDAANRYANTLNADGDQVFNKASYKPYILKNRGLLYVNGFYEPHQHVGVKGTDNYFLHLKSKEIFTLGVVWAEFMGYPTFSIVTTDANEQLATIHNVKKRMPLVISPEERESWLHARDPLEVRQLIRPWAGEFEAHQVIRVTAARGEDTNNPDSQRPIQSA